MRICNFVTYARLVHFQGWTRSEDPFWKTSSEKPFQGLCTSRADKGLESENDEFKRGGLAATLCFHLRRTLKPQGVGAESIIAFKKFLTICFVKWIRSTLKVQEPFTNTSHYSFCNNDPHYSPSPESALHKSQKCGFNFPSSLIPHQAKGIRLLGL